MIFSSKNIAASVAVGCALLATSCSMMHNDVDECPAGLYVRFIYDYNIEHADMFKDHVGHVKLYVYDAAGRKVAEREVSNLGDNQPLKRYGFTMHFDDGELPDGNYRLQAVGLQRDWEEALSTPGAKYRRNTPDQHTDLTVALDHESERHDVCYRYHVSNAAPLDTLWHTLKVIAHQPMDGDAVPPLELDESRPPYSVYPLEEQMVSVKRGFASYATVSMVRDTKHLNVSIRQLDEPDKVADSDYEVTVTGANSMVGHDNELASAEEVLYRPYATWTSTFGAGGLQMPGSRAGAESYATAYYNFMFNRLVYKENAAELNDNARLQIKNKATGEVVADINLTATLAQGRHAWAQYRYGHQEYLDREYDYRLDFILKGDKWLYCDVVINVLNWSKRIQNEVL